MTRRRFYAPPVAFAADEKSATLSLEETRHLRDVLRLHSGDEIYVFDGAGREFYCVVEIIAKDSTELRLISEVEPTRPESPLHLTLGKSLAEAMNSFTARPKEIVAVVGPEGGWTDAEIELARESGWQVVSLGGRTLRAETGAIVAVSLLQHRFGDLV